MHEMTQLTLNLYLLLKIRLSWTTYQVRDQTAQTLNDILVF